MMLHTQHQVQECAALPAAHRWRPLLLFSLLPACRLCSVLTRSRAYSIRCPFMDDNGGLTPPPTLSFRQILFFSVLGPHLSPLAGLHFPDCEHAIPYLNVCDNQTVSTS